MKNLVLSGSNPPLAVAFSANILKISFTWDNSLAETTLELEDGTSTYWPPSIARYLARKYCESNLYGQSMLHRTEVDHWITFSLGPLVCKEEFNQSIVYLDRLLEPVTYLVDNLITLADLFIFEALYKNPKWQSMLEKQEAPLNIKRWYQHLQNLESVAKILSSLNTPAKAKFTRQANPTTNSTRKEEGKFIELEGAEIGKVVVRFPPEASGFLHIGHAKAALLNQYYKDAFKGKLVFRFDDTNPAKEKVDFEKVILEDIALLGLTPDRYTHTSDYFDLMLTYCEKLLKDGKAYIDDTDPETMKNQREQRVKSEAWSNSVDKNLKLWQEMLKGSELGQRCCVRARIDMDSVNGCLRDPTIYRCKPEPHPKTGNKYKVYPTYDFACPIVDSIEDVTHCLRTTEYHDRDDQFYWFIDALGLRKPYIWEYSRLNMTHTLLSKRKLTWFVEQGIVEGWDDPRMPTVRGVLRRGMTVEGLRQFIVAQGSSRSVVVMEWDKIWAFNKKVIDPIAPRYTTILQNDPVLVNVKEAPEQSTKVAKHPKNPEVGEKTIWTGPRVLVDRVDAELFKPQENVTFINWGNLVIERVQRDNNGKITSVDARTNLTNTDFKKTLKVTWLAETAQAPMTPCIGIYLDHLITKPVLGKDEDFKNFIAKDTKTTIKMLGDPELKSIKKSDIIQLQRRGFFICDQEYKPPSIYSGVETPCVLIYVPDGHSKQPLINTEPDKEKSRSNEVKTPQDDQLASRIISQADHVRQLKTKKAEKAEIDAAVQTLLKLKAEYKSETGQEWKVPSPAKSGSLPTQQTNLGLNEKITQQGEKVRQLKASKTDKKLIDPEVKTLLELKAEFKKVTGSDWKPGVVVTPPKQENQSLSGNESSDLSKESELNEKITQQGEKVRQLKASKTDKKLIDPEVKTLLELKAEFKKVTGSDWKPGVVVTPPKQENQSLSGNESSDLSKESELNEKITQQGEKVRQLKASKADKKLIDPEVKTLLELKAEFKKVTGSDWKPGVVVTPPKQGNQSLSGNESSDLSKECELNEKITQQGEKVRQLKSNKADKKLIDSEVKTLLELKAEFKKATGTDWKPSVVQTPPKQENQSISENELSDLVSKQGDKVRQLKAEKAEKKIIDSEVQKLLALKKDYKEATGQEWKPKNINSNQAKFSEHDLNNKIIQQGDKIRQLKAQKADKLKIEPEVKILLELKAQFKTTSGQDWKPVTTTASSAGNSENTINLEGKPTTSVKTQMDSTNELTSKIQQQGNEVRQLKESKADKAQIDAAVKILLSLKAEYKALTNHDWTPSGGSTNENKRAPKKQKDNSKPKPIEQSSGGEKKQTRLGLEAKKEENLPEWYSQVITKGELISYYNVSGCYILRPWAFSIWKQIKNFIDQELEKLGVEDCYFPMFVSKGVLEKEKQHISDFSPEVAWVTHSGESELAEPIAIRPTSETGMYPAFADWIQSHRDLPLRLNQWNNVVRWEFKHPQPFLRTREFLWQEGHTAWAKQTEAEEEVVTILNIYERVYSELLAIPVIKGRKTEKEKFAGGNYTTTTEAFIAASGRAIQGATSHHLGQNFSRMFEITFEDPETQKEQYVYQNSWGLTTRVIGVMIMVHADNQGLVLPPKVASKQVVIIPCGISVNLSQPARDALFDTCRRLEQNLIDLGIRVKCDLRDNYSPGWKFNHWELKGVPLRIELGPKDLEKKQMVAVRRDTGEKLTIPEKDLLEVCKLLEKIQANLLDKATKELDSHLKICRKWDDFCGELEQKNIILAPFCEAIPCEEKIKKDSARDEEADSGAPSMGAKSLCIPFKQPAKIEDTDMCIHPDCKEKAKSYTLFGRSY